MCFIPKIPPIHNNKITVKLDSGASKHYFRPCDTPALENITSVHNGPNVTLPNGSYLQIKHKGTIPLPPNIDKLAGEVNIVPNLKSASLLSVGQFTDHGCTAELSQHEAEIKKDQHVLLHGRRNFHDGLWDIELPIVTKEPLKQHMNVIIKLDGNKSELADFIHGCLFSPCPSTLMKAVRNKHFLSWPGIDKINFLRYANNNIATLKGHFNQERKNLRSTKNNLDIVTSDDSFPIKSAVPKAHLVMSSLVSYTPKNKAYGDLTGQFPYKSSRGNAYIYVLYHYDSNHPSTTIAGPS